MKKIREFLMGKPRWFTVPRWKLLVMIFSLIIVMLIAWIWPWIGIPIMLVYCIYEGYKIIKEERA